jgi:type I restriction enzyme S subunit
MNVLPDGWRELTLGSVALYINGRAFKPSEWKKTGLPIIRIQNLNDPKKEFNRFDGEYDQKHYVEKGDILISWSGSLGVYVWDGEPALLNQHIFKVLPNESVVDRRYFVYAVRTILDEMKSRVHGSTMRHIVKGDFQSLIILAPPIDVQRRIAQVLDRAERLLLLRERANELTNKIAKALFLQMFGDPTANPFGFPKKTLGSLAIVCRYGPRFYNEPYCEDGTAILRTTDITEDGEFSLSNCPKLRASPGDIKRYRLRRGDLVISRTGTKLGRCTVYDTDAVDCIPGAFLLHFRFSEEIVPEYVKHFILSASIRKRILRMRRFVGQPNVNAGELKSLNVPVPPLNLQTRFIEMDSMLRKLAARQKQSFEEINELFRSLMQKAFSGGLTAQEQPA